MVSTGSLVRKAIGKDEGMIGLVLEIESKTALPAYVVFKEDGQITDWMTCFVDVLSES